MREYDPTTQLPPCAEICQSGGDCTLREEELICEAPNTLEGMPRDQLYDLAEKQRELGNYGPLAALDVLAEVYINDCYPGTINSRPAMQYGDDRTVVTLAVHVAQEKLQNAYQQERTLSQEEYDEILETVRYKDARSWGYEERGVKTEDNETRLAWGVRRNAEMLAGFNGRVIAPELRMQLLYLAGIARGVARGTHDEFGHPQNP